MALQDLLHWARRRGILNKLEAQLLVASHVADIPMNQLVTTFGRSRSTLFAMRSAAEQRLREALAQQTPEQDGTAGDDRAAVRRPTAARTGSAARSAAPTAPYPLSAPRSPPAQRRGASRPGAGRAVPRWRGFR